MYRTEIVQCDAAAISRECNEHEELGWTLAQMTGDIYGIILVFHKDGE